MNDHVIPMFVVTRAEIEARMTAKLESIAVARSQLEAAQAEAMFEAHKVGLASGLKTLADLAARVEFMRAHLAPASDWAVSAQQAVELLTFTDPVIIDPAELKFGINPEAQVRDAAHNAQGRRLRM